MIMLENILSKNTTSKLEILKSIFFFNLELNFIVLSFTT
jgi:hypothetical protein